MTPLPPLVLIVEDEPAIADVLAAYLRRASFRVDLADTASRAVAGHRTNRPDVVLLDLGLPDGDGFELLRRLRDVSDTPVVIVTALADDVDKLLGLRLGADDYVVKPFSPPEVVARVQAVLRRARPAPPPASRWRVGPLEIEADNFVARVHGVRLALTLTEFRLLAHLARTPDRVFTRAELLGAVAPDSTALERTVDAHLGQVRRQLEAHGAHGLLDTVRGVGYRVSSAP